MPTDETAPATPATAPAKASRRRDCRVAAMQFLYMWDANPSDDLPGVLTHFFSEQEHPREYYAFAEELIHGLLDTRRRLTNSSKTTRTTGPSTASRAWTSPSCASGFSNSSTAATSRQ